MVVPDGNCRYGPKSGRVIDKKQIAIWHDDIMTVLILSDHLGNDSFAKIAGRARARPLKNLCEAIMRCQ